MMSLDIHAVQAGSISMPHCSRVRFADAACSLNDRFPHKRHVLGRGSLRVNTGPCRQLRLIRTKRPKPSQRRLGHEPMSRRLGPDRWHFRSPRPAPAIGKQRITDTKVRADGPIRLNFRRPAPRFRSISRVLTLALRLRAPRDYEVHGSIRASTRRGARGREDRG